jgi:hypothetical protein
MTTTPIKLNWFKTLCLVAWLSLAIAILVPYASSQKAPEEPGVKLDLSNTLSKLKSRWDEGDIVCVVISHVTSGVEYRVEWTPDALDKEAFFRLAVRFPKGQNVTKQLMQQVERISATENNEKVWVRWGFVFINEKGDRLFSVYLNDSGTKGFINGRSVGFGSNDLGYWAEKTFKSIF